MKKLINFFLKDIACVFVFNLLYRVEVKGLENIPRQGKAILASNHASYLDPMILYHITPRKFHAVADKSLFKLWWLGWVFTKTDCVPTNGSSKGAIATLNKEEMILIFPEGECRCGCDRILNPRIHKGVAVFALKAGAPVIPISIKGSFEAWPITRLFPRFFKKISISIGPALLFDKCHEETIPLPLLEKALEKIMSSIKELLY